MSKLDQDLPISSAYIVKSSLLFFYGATMLNSNKFILILLIFIITVIGYYNALAFYKIMNYIFNSTAHQSNLLLSISFINALHFFFRPLGGWLCNKLQLKTKNLILPYFVLFYALYNFGIVNLINLFSFKLGVIILLCNFILVGCLLGGAFPQIILSLLNQKYPNTTRKIILGNLYFITIFTASILAKFSLILHNPTNDLWFFQIVPFVFVIVALWLFFTKSLWVNFQLDNSAINSGQPWNNTLRRYWLVILRFTCFLTFITSLNAFFTTAMPFYLEHYLNYPEKEVLLLQILLFIFGILGLIIGGIYHSKLGKRLHLTMGVLIKIMLYFLFKSYVNNNLYIIGILECLCMFGLGLMMSKILNLIYSIFPANYKLSGITIIYDFSFGLLSGVSVYLSTYLIHQFNNLYIPSMIIVVFSYLSLISLWFTPNSDFFRYDEE